MVVLEILCHPMAGSLNHAIAARARERLASLGHPVVYHDLYAEGFDPVLPADEIARGFSFDERVLAHQRDVTSADGLLVVHPDWWGQPPAMLKGWLDRVLRPGVAYEFSGGDFEEKRRVPLLSGKTALVICTSDAPEGRSLQALRTLWEEGILGWCGLAASCVTFAEARRSSASRRLHWMRQIDARIAAAFPPAAAGTA